MVKGALASIVAVSLVLSATAAVADPTSEQEMLSPLPPPDRPGEGWRVATWAFGSITVAGAVSWGYAYHRYSTAETRLGSEACGAQFVTEEPGLRERCSWLIRGRVAGVITLSGLAVTGVSLYMGYIRPPRADRVTVAPLVSPDTAGLALTGAW